MMAMVVMVVMVMSGWRKGNKGMNESMHDLLLFPISHHLLDIVSYREDGGEDGGDDGGDDDDGGDGVEAEQEENG